MQVELTNANKKIVIITRLQSQSCLNRDSSNSRKSFSHVSCNEKFWSCRFCSHLFITLLVEVYQEVIKYELQFLFALLSSLLCFSCNVSEMTYSCLSAILFCSRFVRTPPHLFTQTKNENMGIQAFTVHQSAIWDAMWYLILQNVVSNNSETEILYQMSKSLSVQTTIIRLVENFIIPKVWKQEIVMGGLRCLRKIQTFSTYIHML